MTGDRADAGLGITIRAAELRDVDQVLELVRALAAFEELPGPDVQAEERFRAHFVAAPSPFEVLVAHAPGAPKLDAYALTFTTYSTFLARPSLWLEDLFVRPEARKKGIARAMLARLAETAVTRGCGRFEWSVLDWNENAQRFYRSLGADVLPDWRICRLTGAKLAELGATDGANVKTK